MQSHEFVQGQVDQIDVILFNIFVVMLKKIVKQKLFVLIFSSNSFKYVETTSNINSVFPLKNLTYRFKHFM